MKLIRFGAPGQEKPGILQDDGTRLDVSGFGRDYDEAFFGGSGLDDLRAWLQENAARAPRVDASARLGPPVTRPSKIVCIGLNFRDHAAETGADIPTEPVIFFKATSALCGPDDPLVIPRGATKVDWEVELAFVIGRVARYVHEERGFEHIAGYVLHNDYSERSFQLERGGQWSKGKSADTFAPLGPFLATRDEIQDPQALPMWLKVNGEIRQKSNTSQQIFDCGTVLSYLSRFMTLLPGDVVSTGTPPGVALGMKPEPVYLKAGDVVELGIDGLGSSRQQAVEWR
jgi:2-keto-4-pentenoate hydratase/2-oxohepta-3-ene-1,7-dioic acid hydratase in catechol pathway